MNIEKKTDNGGKSRSRFWGWVLFILSSVFWVFALFIGPFLPLTLKVKAAVVGGSYLVAEVTFYVCIPLLGKDYVTKIWRRFIPGKQAPEEIQMESDGTTNRSEDTK